MLTVPTFEKQSKTSRKRKLYKTVRKEIKLFPNCIVNIHNEMIDVIIQMEHEKLYSFF